MEIRLSDPGRLQQLSTFLALDPDAHVRATPSGALEVWYVDSRNVWAQEMELELRLRAWMAANPDVVATVTP